MVGIGGLDARRIFVVGGLWRILFVVWRLLFVVWRILFVVWRILFAVVWLWRILFVVWWCLRIFCAFAVELGRHVCAIERSILGVSDGFDSSGDAFEVCAALDVDAVDEYGWRAGDVGFFGVGHVFDDDDGESLTFDGVEDVFGRGAESFDLFGEEAGRNRLLIVE